MPTVQELEVAGHHVVITTPDHMVPLDPADYDGVDAYEEALRNQAAEGEAARQAKKEAQAQPKAVKKTTKK